jgi:hypothetical protein
VLCLVELRGFEPLTPCMPYTDLQAHHGRLQLTSWGLVVRGAPWLTVVDRCLAAPGRPRWRSVLALGLHGSSGGGLEAYDLAMATVRYQSRGRRGAQVLDGRYGRSAIWIDANRPGLDRWGITLEGCSIGKGPAPGRDEARRRGEPGAGGAAPDGCNLLVGHRV